MRGGSRLHRRSLQARLHFDVPWPASTVLHDMALDRYNLVFDLVLKVRRTNPLPRLAGGRPLRTHSVTHELSLTRRSSGPSVTLTAYARAGRACECSERPCATHVAMTVAAWHDIRCTTTCDTKWAHCTAYLLCECGNNSVWREAGSGAVAHGDPNLGVAHGALRFADRRRG